ncbi:MAG: nucleotidyltransferase domain-containing protein [Acidobacteriota bacterium]
MRAILRDTIADPEHWLSERLAEHESIRFALLFGSRAHGRERANSDWDVAFFCGEGADETSRFELRRRLASELEDLGRVDIISLDDAPPLLAHRALQGRQLLMRDKVAYVRFFVKTMALADDARHWAKIHRRARRRRLEEESVGRS